MSIVVRQSILLCTTREDRGRKKLEKLESRYYTEMNKEASRQREALCSLLEQVGVKVYELQENEALRRLAQELREKKEWKDLFSSVKDNKRRAHRASKQKTARELSAHSKRMAAIMSTMHKSFTYEAARLHSTLFGTPSKPPLLKNPVQRHHHLAGPSVTPADLYTALVTAEHDAFLKKQRKALLSSG
eukprot:TRINITY_DN27821_c0_g1_i1.p1 TRINITY_DN27821_c0_g1~~TRINITY_DN27821_c0_g1_i1.p1  ORF type:complete len:188 (+),score=31.30 TRINITY_DN27821_c0_g1_i1:108-671(+)